MKYNIIDEGIPYAISLAEGLMVTHSEVVTCSKDYGRELYGFIHLFAGQIRFEFLDDHPPISIFADQTIYIPKGFRYICHYPPEYTEVAIFQFDFQENSAHLPPQEVIVLSTNTERLFRNFTEQYSQLNPLRCAARIYDLLDILLQEPPSMPKKHRRLQPAIEHMEQNPAADTDVAFYAELCGMSPSGFRRSFKEYLGLSPIDYRNNLRLNYARKLLTSGEYSVTQAAYQSGFSNISFFYRLFRRKFGTSPGNL